MRVGVWGWSNGGYMTLSVMTRAAQLHGTRLLVHGSYDDNVPPTERETFMDALVNAGKTFELMVYPMRKHDIGDRDANNHLCRTVIEFWKRNL